MPVSYTHLRPLCVFDVLRRYLEYRGYHVKFVQNFTDIDDKIIKRAKIGTKFSFGEGKLIGEIVNIDDNEGSRFVKFTCEGSIYACLLYTSRCV